VDILRVDLASLEPDDMNQSVNITDPKESCKLARMLHQSTNCKQRSLSDKNTHKLGERNKVDGCCSLQRKQDDSQRINGGGRTTSGNCASSCKDGCSKLLLCGAPAKKDKAYLPSQDDLRDYAYEGDGSTPGSLSSCCSGGI